MLSGSRQSRETASLELGMAWQEHRVLQELPQGQRMPPPLHGETNLFVTGQKYFPICKVRIILFIPGGSSECLGNEYTWLPKYNPLQGQPFVRLTELGVHVFLHISHISGWPQMGVPAHRLSPYQEPPCYQLIIRRGRGNQIGYAGRMTCAWWIAVYQATSSIPAY